MLRDLEPTAKNGKPWSDSFSIVCIWGPKRQIAFAKLENNLSGECGPITGVVANNGLSLHLREGDLHIKYVCVFDELTRVSHRWITTPFSIRILCWYPCPLDPASALRTHISRLTTPRSRLHSVHFVISKMEKGSLSHISPTFIPLLRSARTSSDALGLTAGVPAALTPPLTKCGASSSRTPQAPGHTLSRSHCSDPTRLELKIRTCYVRVLDGSAWLKNRNYRCCVSTRLTWPQRLQHSAPRQLGGSWEVYGDGGDLEMRHFAQFCARGR